MLLIICWSLGVGRPGGREDTESDGMEEGELDGDEWRMVMHEQKQSIRTEVGQKEMNGSWWHWDVRNRVSDLAWGVLGGAESSKQWSGYHHDNKVQQWTDTSYNFDLSDSWES